MMHTILKKTLTGIFYLLVLPVLFSCSFHPSEYWIRVNQIGYPTDALKVAVVAGKSSVAFQQAQLIDVESGKVVFTTHKREEKGAYGPFSHTYRIDFSEFNQAGKYRLQIGKTQSPVFTIHETVYQGTADFMLRYMRQQRCGYNPFLQDSCHTRDGYTLYAPVADGTPIDVTGGWHDASDYLQYVATSANATYQMLLAYQENPQAFADEYLANGLPGKNGLPDVLDEAKWGLDWLVKMHPKEDWMFNQIADDRDHAGYRLPNKDSVVYDFPEGRPVYFCTGEVQGVFGNKNRTTGVASTAGKFSSALALGHQIFQFKDPEYARKLYERALSAYQLGKGKPGPCQTAPGKAPYFYEEDNWVDDMELAASELYTLTRQKNYQKEALDFARQEPVTPWIENDTARHYQWYPFLNVGHYRLAQQTTGQYKKELIAYYKKGIETVWQRAKNNAFLQGTPFIWCSNNLVAAFATQCYLYRQLSGDQSYLPLETASIDWLFGCNPWGTSMIIGLPEKGVSPKTPHSSLAFLHQYRLDGGLVDGPVYTRIFQSLKGIHLVEEDEYAAFQSDLSVYHDDFGDYSTNEPTMDGTASLIYLLSALAKPQKNFTLDHGGIIRGDTQEPSIALLFSGHVFADGAQEIISVLEKQEVKASFFFTGDFYRKPAFHPTIQTLVQNGHYLGAHSDKHLLYCSWENRDSLLVNKQEFLQDLNDNYEAMKSFGIKPQVAKYFLPPYEWYNRQISHWAKEEGIQVINFSPGTRSNADYTVPEMGNRYVSGEQIYQSILDYEVQHEKGLNGFQMLLHIGTAPERTDKFHRKLNALIGELKARGYAFKRVDELLKN
ncbi:glycoside hydrolase family 9 protein [Rapidithrix thailandica]|uniref:Glycoside hydrolase family 9 protein n=1 Tax=Rapidithrix thailandica TaxID=413964 RepID=A0AAW9S0A7_9BACT